MDNSTLIGAWQAELKKSGMPATSASSAALALCRVLDHQFYIRDRAHGDLIAQVEKLRSALHDLKHRGDDA